MIKIYPSPTDSPFSLSAAKENLSFSAETPQKTSPPVLKYVKPSIWHWLVYPGILLLIAILSVIGANLAFPRPTQHDEAKWGIVHVDLADGDFDQEERAQISEGLKDLERLGPSFVLGGNGTSVIRILSANLTDSQGRHCSMESGISRYVTDQSLFDSHIEIDPTCLHGNLEFRTAVMHEIGHAVGMSHICRSEDSASTIPGLVCSPVGRGRAVMNPSVFEPGITDPAPCYEVQPLDIREFNRSNPNPPAPGASLIISLR